MIALLAALAVAAAPAPTLQGEWRIVRGSVAPWVEDGSALDAAARVGQRVVYHADRVEGPDVLACANARYEAASLPFDHLFQGNLAQGAEPAARLAEPYGLVTAPVASVSVACDSGLFDLHFATPDAALLALDNVVWVLDRSPGALAAPATPEQAVQALLQDHYAHGLEFTAARTQAQRARFTDALATRIAAYFAQDFPEEEAPPINGDPFTDAQEYFAHFSVRAATIDGATARVPVRFDNGYEPRTVEYRLAREAGTWKLDDLGYDHGTFAELLALRP